jgi:hypothetical protein
MLSIGRRFYFLTATSCQLRNELFQRLGRALYEHIGQSLIQCFEGNRFVGLQRIMIGSLVQRPIQWATPNPLADDRQWPFRHMFSEAGRSDMPLGPVKVAR